MALLINLIGERGGGKSTFATAIAAMIREGFPDAIIAANIGLKIPNTIYCPDILEWIAEAILDDNNEYKLVIIDEAAISGFESYGSIGISAAIKSYLLAVSRKFNLDIIMISQLMSMLQKRGQWLSDYDTLCTSTRESPASYKFEIPDYFTYSTYDQNQKKVSEWDCYGVDAYEYIFPKFDTREIPNEDDLLIQFIQYFRITEDKMKEFYDSINASELHRNEGMTKLKQYLSALTPTRSIEYEIGPAHLDKYAYVRKGNLEMYMLKEGEREDAFQMVRKGFEKCGFHYVHQADRPTEYPNLYWEKMYGKDSEEIEE